MHKRNTRHILAQKRRKPNRNKTYKKLKQPTIQSWLQKLSITHHLNQTQQQWNIHNEQQHEVQRNEILWKQNGEN